LYVATGDDTSAAHRIFSGVPQGGKWSAPLWNFEISTLQDLGLTGQLLCYADDACLIYEITKDNKATLLDAINADLQLLEDWGKLWFVSFEPSKTHSIVISRKRVPFDSTGISFLMGLVKQVKTMKLVGFIIDDKWTFKPMIEHIAKKGRIKLGAIRRLQQHLDSSNLEMMYNAFVRSSLEYGSLAYLSAAPSLVAKLDKIQSAAQKLGNFDAVSLGLRRDASLVGFTLKLLDGRARGQLNDFIPLFSKPDNCRRSSRHFSNSSVIEPTYDFRGTTNMFDRSIEGQISRVWSNLPNALIVRGGQHGWRSITKECQRFLAGKTKAQVS
jgi:hypothetical protein